MTLEIAAFSLDEALGTGNVGCWRMIFIARVSPLPFAPRSRT